MSGKKKFDPYHVVLDEEEKDILESYELGEWKTVDNIEEERAFARKAAANYLRKNARVNIRISSSDLENIKSL